LLGSEQVKSLVLLTSSGEFGFAPGGPRAHMDHWIPHLHTVSRYFGINVIYRVAIEYQEFNDERHQQSVSDAHLDVVRVVEELSQHRKSLAASRNVISF
jgi:FMN-dependent NADH-azoreductase